MLGLQAVLRELNELLQRVNELIADFFVLDAEIDVGGKVFDPVACVETLAVDAHGHHAALFAQLLEGVRELDFAADAGFRGVEAVENVGREHVAAHDGQAGFSTRLFTL